MPLASTTLRCPLLADDEEFAGDPGDSTLDAAAIGFELGFAVTSHPDAALLAGQVAPEPR